MALAMVLLVQRRWPWWSAAPAVSAPSSCLGSILSSFFVPRPMVGLGRGLRAVPCRLVACRRQAIARNGAHRTDRLWFRTHGCHHPGLAARGGSRRMASGVGGARGAGTATRGHFGLVFVPVGGCSNRAPGPRQRLRAVVQRAVGQLHSREGHSLYQPSMSTSCRTGGGGGLGSSCDVASWTYPTSAIWHSFRRLN